MTTRIAEIDGAVPGVLPDLESQTCQTRSGSGSG